jgi:hypothetical protein
MWQAASRRPTRILSQRRPRKHSARPRRLSETAPQRPPSLLDCGKTTKWGKTPTGTPYSPPRKPLRPSGCPLGRRAQAVVKAGRRCWQAAHSAITRPRLDGGEPGVILRYVGRRSFNGCYGFACADRSAK